MRQQRPEIDQKRPGRIAGNEFQRGVDVQTRRLGPVIGIERTRRILRGCFGHAKRIPAAELIPAIVRRNRPVSDPRLPFRPQVPLAKMARPVASLLQVAHQIRRAWIKPVRHIAGPVVLCRRKMPVDAEADRVTPGQKRRATRRTDRARRVKLAERGPAGCQAVEVGGREVGWPRQAASPRPKSSARMKRMFGFSDASPRAAATRRPAASRPVVTRRSALVVR